MKIGLPQCCGKKMEKQEIHYGQNWQCFKCGRQVKTPANGMTQKDIVEYCKKRQDFAKH